MFIWYDYSLCSYTHNARAPPAKSPGEIGQPECRATCVDSEEDVYYTFE